jgi:hypothetical protein
MVWFLAAARDFTSQLCSHQLWGPASFLSCVYWRLFHQGLCGQDMKLTGHLHLVLSLWMCGTIPPLPHTSSWRGNYLCTGNLCLFLIWFLVSSSFSLNWSWYSVVCRNIIINALVYKTVWLWSRTTNLFAWWRWNKSINHLILWCSILDTSFQSCTSFSHRHYVDSQLMSARSTVMDQFLQN